MSTVIENYYGQTNIPPLLLKQKLNKFSRHKDIQKEFEYWIIHQEYIRGGISVEGYTAKSLAALSEYVDGEAAFMLLIELRDAPHKALRRIKSGFKLK